MSAPPFMQLYVADYLGDTQHLTAEQHGAYLLLLMTMWRNGGFLPADPSKLARIARVSARRWHLLAPEVMAFFDVIDGNITQKRLVEEYQKAVSISEKRSHSGKLGGDAKALKNNDAALANAKQLPKHSQISDIIKEDTRANARDARASELASFDAFWAKYPNKTGKPKALAAYRSALKRATADEIAAGLDRYIASKPEDRQWLNPATFLNQDRWADEPATVISRPATGPPGGGLGDLIRASEQRIQARRNQSHEPPILQLVGPGRP